MLRILKSTNLPYLQNFNRKVFTNPHYFSHSLTPPSPPMEPKINPTKLKRSAPASNSNSLSPSKLYYNSKKILINEAAKSNMTIMDAFKAQTSKDSVDKPPSPSAPQPQEANFFSGPGQWDQSTLMISNWNVNGIRAVLSKGELQNYFTSKNPDILILNETKIDSTRYEVDRPDKGIPSEYFQYWNFCKVKKGYSGVALFTKIKPICIKEGMGVEKHDQEGRLITAEFEKFYVVGTYVPNSGDGLVRLKYRTKEWNVDFQKYLNGLREKKNVVLAGDLNVAHRNIDLHDPKGKEK